MRRAPAFHVATLPSVSSRKMAYSCMDSTRRRNISSLWRRTSGDDDGGSGEAGTGRPCSVTAPPDRSARPCGRECRHRGTPRDQYPMEARGPGGARARGLLLLPRVARGRRRGRILAARLALSLVARRRLVRRALVGRGLAGRRLTRRRGLSRSGLAGTRLRGMTALAIVAALGLAAARRRRAAIARALGRVLALA